MIAHRLLHLVALAAVTFPPLAMPQQPSGGKWNPSAVERVRLPQYCQAQFDAAWAKQYRVPTPMDLCGVGMNHFCPALVQLNRARSTLLTREERKAHLQDAMAELGYTRQRIPANCSIMTDFRTAEAQAKTLSQLLK